MLGTVEVGSPKVVLWIADVDEGDAVVDDEATLTDSRGIRNLSSVPAGREEEFDCLDIGTEEGCVEWLWQSNISY
jgi:hypothetical protein